MGRTLFWLLVSFAVTAGITLVLWHFLDVPVFFGFLFLPFFFGFGKWFGGGERTVEVRRCPVCGFRSADPDVRYCPRDGTPL